MGLQGGGWPLDVERYACLVGLIDRGHVGKITLSQDYILHMLGRPFVLPGALRPSFADWHPTHVFRDVIPALRAGGVTEAQIETILVDNPRRLFGGG
jgi:phosphotriesterase-related protein